jgi:DNA-binding CsgD family transcriptional regulator
MRRAYCGESDPRTAVRRFHQAPAVGARMCARARRYCRGRVRRVSDGHVTRFVGAGIAVFVSEDFLREAKSIPHFWIAPKLAERINLGPSPLLSDSEVRDRNSTTGLNLVVWHDSSLPEDMTRAEVGTASMNAFDESFRGYRLQEILAQADCVEHLWVMRNAGGLYFDPIGWRHGDFPKVNSSNFLNEPRCVGMTRELALTHGASWVGSLFLHPPPQFGFSRGEQKQLRLALVGVTDEELAEALGITIFTVKKNWVSIYDRVAVCRPELVPADSQMGDSGQRRGKQKKQRLLAYLREHPEEFRPVSRKLLRQQGRITQDRR